ncbi:retrovirus-related pol polyprotein from transposon TNT 1-94, partial [Tanacetum coccineum]
EKVFAIKALENDVRKLKGKYIVNNAAQVSNVITIAPGLYKLDQVPLDPKVKNNMEAHIYYLQHTMEEAVILREIVEQANSLNPLDSASYSACKHDLSFLDFVNDMNACSKSKSVKKAKKKEEWKPTGKVFTKIGYNWRPTGRTFTLVRNVCPLTRITSTNKVPFRKPTPPKVVAQEPVVTKIYTRRPKVPKTIGSSRKPKIAKSMISNKTKPSTSWGSNTLVAPSSSYLVNYRSSKLFCGICTPDVPSIWIWGLSDRECHNFKGLLCGRTRTQSILSCAINHLAKNGLVRGLPKLKFEKDHLCAACVMGKSKKQTHKPKSEDTNEEKLYLLHMDLCGPMRVASVNGKKYILIIMDDYSRPTWVKFLASKDEALDFIIKFLKMIHVRLNATVRNIRTDNGTEFVNQTQCFYYESVGISHETPVA